MTSRWERIRSSPTLRGVGKFVATAAVGGIIAALIGGWIGDRFADQQLEVTIEADLVQETSQAALIVYEQAQNASRIRGDLEKRRAARDAAANTWVETTHGSLTPKFESYYGKEAAVTQNWYAYQDAVYVWSVLACCTEDDESRQRNNQDLWIGVSHAACWSPPC